MNPRIKVCGLTRFEDALLAQQCGAWALGFIFAEKSPRRVTVDSVKNILQKISKATDKTSLKIGVFQNQSVDFIVQTVKELSLDGIQWHGQEDVDFFEQCLLSLPKNLFLIKAYTVDQESLFQQQSVELQLKSGQKLWPLIDSVKTQTLKGEKQVIFGGTGHTVDWDLAKKWSQSYPIILSGGLGPDNLDLAMAQVRPWALDLSSSVEETPGVKNPALLKKLFIERV